MFTHIAGPHRISHDIIALGALGSGQIAQKFEPFEGFLKDFLRKYMGQECVIVGVPYTPCSILKLHQST